MAVLPQSINTCRLLGKMSVEYLKNTNVLAKKSNTNYNYLYQDKSYKSGDTVDIPLDNQTFLSRGDTIDAQNIVDQKMTVVLQDLYSNAQQFTTTTQSVSIRNMTEQVVRPAMSVIINGVESAMHQAVLTGSFMTLDNTVSGFNSFDTIEQGRVMLSENAVDDDGSWMMAVSNQDLATLRSSLLNYFTPMTNEKVLVDGSPGKLSAFQIYPTQDIVRHLSGAAAAYPGLTLGAGVTDGDTSITVTGFGGVVANTFYAGDKITFAGIYAVNPITRNPVGRLFQLTVTADAGSSDGGGSVVVQITTSYQAIYIAANNPYLNTFNPSAPNTIPSGTGVSVLDNFTSCPMYKKSGMILVTPKLDKFYVANELSSVHTDPDTGLSVRVTMFALPLNNLNLVRFDLLMGTAPVGNLVGVNASPYPFA